MPSLVKYITQVQTTLLSNNINQKLNNIKEYNINYPITTTNKDSKKIKHVYIQITIQLQA